MLIIEQIQLRRRQMNIFHTLIGFLNGSDDSMRLDAARKRVKELDNLRYYTIADSKREMRGDMERLRGDFHKAIREASKDGKKSRTE